MTRHQKKKLKKQNSLPHPSHKSCKCCWVCGGDPWPAGIGRVCAQLSRNSHLGQDKALGIHWGDTDPIRDPSSPWGGDTDPIRGPSSPWTLNPSLWQLWNAQLDSNWGNSGAPGWDRTAIWDFGPSTARGSLTQLRGGFSCWILAWAAQTPPGCLQEFGQRKRRIASSASRS